MIRQTANAKINWFLEITGKRPDGYHLLDIWFQTISLGDRLTFRNAPHLTLTCTDAALPTDERNLAMKAAIGLQKLLREKRGAHIHLEKIAPRGAGLGGGSADAAAVLRGLLKLWRRGIAAPALRRLAVSLGADVPFFLTGGTCSAKGIGEKLIVHRAVPKTWLVVVWPGFGVATKDAYAKVRLPFTNARKSSPRIGSGRAMDTNLLFNRFESLVFPDYPAIQALKQDLIDAGATASLMSGSGSAVFGMVPSKSVGEAVIRKIAKRYPHHWLAHTI